jgi:putative DNA primase/helicase
MEKQKKIEFLSTLNKEKVQVPTVCMENVCRILHQDNAYKNTLKKDLFTQNILYKNELIQDEDLQTIVADISVRYPFLQKVSSFMVEEAIKKVSYDNRYDSIVDYFKSLVWDNVPRIDTWLTTVYGTPNDEYHRAVGSNFLKAIVQRNVHPGSKFDHVFVVESSQGKNKSTAFSILGGEWYVETSMSTDTKDFFMQLQGKMIVEFAEGETLSRTEVKRMKAIITTQVDRFRPAYGRFMQEYKRRCVFTMTTNEDTYLKDDTGNRRWLPTKLEREGGADIKWLKENRDQLFAEAYHRVINLKETYWEFPIEETLRQQELRQEEHPWEGLVDDWYWNELSEQERRDGITVTYIFDNVIHKNLQSKPISKYDEMIIATILKKLGLDKKRIHKGGARLTKWFLVDDSRISILPLKKLINGYEF